MLYHLSKGRQLQLNFILIKNFWLILKLIKIILNGWIWFIAFIEIILLHSFKLEVFLLVVDKLCSLTLNIFHNSLIILFLNLFLRLSLQNFGCHFHLKGVSHLIYLLPQIFRYYRHLMGTLHFIEFNIQFSWFNIVNHYSFKLMLSTS